MGNKDSSLRRKSTKIEFDKEIDNNPIGLEEEKELKLEYLIPDSHEAIDRAHIFHFFQRFLFQSNFSSPIDERLTQEKCKVLDIGCGPGTWLLDLASKYENSLFYGIDNNSIYPSEIKPGNLNFIKADMFDRFPFPDNEFDFVHQGLTSFINPDQLNFIISEMIRVTKPGGYIELLELRNEFKGVGPIVKKINEAHISYCLKRRIDMERVPNIGNMIKSNQNTPIVYKDEKLYVSGPNGGKIGMVFQDIYIGFHSSDAVTDNLCPIIGISKEDYKIMIIKDLIEELKHTSPEHLLIRFWAKKN
ncbi:hypothetical protein RclHR1_01970008 [Rhizophagus clarus]|uniref:S-adenosyl-L-methionine-dependent methyltransferase n=1 Tax=Rhizophagus clarus TaxID=94130 RepID=A0A2Z6RIA4_9GLOM|nr:hypothetical protein RclHR1_01970008 [Rhizophagus clarus]GES97726.1 S-adenosyl-L-methionine-dependent methyltransferase [Rhizophagus clarus]